jgi:hypothetical protein
MLPVQHGHAFRFPALATTNEDHSYIHETLPFFVKDSVRYKGRNVLLEDGRDDC